jgi:hypothetical protein
VGLPIPLKSQGVPYKVDMEKWIYRKLIYLLQNFDNCITHLVPRFAKGIGGMELPMELRSEPDSRRIEYES